MCPLLHPPDTYIGMLLLVAVQANGSTAGGSIESGERDNVRICQMLYTSTLATLRREEQGRVLYIGQVPWSSTEHPPAHLPTYLWYICACEFVAQNILRTKGSRVPFAVVRVHAYVGSCPSRVITCTRAASNWKSESDPVASPRPTL